MNKPGDVSGECLLTPSPSIKKFGEAIVSAAMGRPILDVACGGGRNSAWVSHLGGRAIAIDIDLSNIRANISDLPDSILAQALRRIELQQLDLIRDPWPFLPRSVGGLINIHFLHKPLLEAFSKSLVSGGLLILETIEARGGNYLQLPEAGFLKKALQEYFDFPVYIERRVKTGIANAASVKLVGKRR